MVFGSIAAEVLFSLKIIQADRNVILCTAQSDFLTLYFILLCKNPMIDGNYSAQPVLGRIVGVSALW